MLKNPIRFEFISGLMICLGWPLFFGFMVTGGWGGKLGMLVGLCFIAVGFVSLVVKYKKLYPIMARGLWILALASAIPIAPFFLGEKIIRCLPGWTVDRGNQNWQTELGFSAALISTTLFSGVYLVTAYLSGLVTLWLIRVKKST